MKENKIIPMVELVISDHVPNVIVEVSINKIWKKLEGSSKFIKVISIEGYEYIIAKSRIIFVYNSIKRGKKSGEM